MSKDHDQHDDEDDVSEPQAHAASEAGPTTYDQAAWVESTPTGEADQMPDVVIYGEAGVHHESEWTEVDSSTSREPGESVSKVVRAEESEAPTHVSASAKAARPEQRYGRR